MNLHVIDAYGVFELEELVEVNQRVTLYSALTSEVSAGRLTFPDAVLSECRTLGQGESAAIWLVGVAGSRQHSSFPGSTPMQVLAKIPGLLAVDDMGEQPQVAVACLASAKVEAGLDLTVVTEDPGFGGDRITLAEACSTLAIPCTNVRSYLGLLGLSSCII